MADRIALRLDEDAAADLEFLSSVYGTQTAADGERVRIVTWRA